MKPLVILISLPLIFGKVLCQEGIASPLAAPRAEITVVTASSVVSQYVFRGERLGGLSLQPYIECDAANLRFGLWVNTPIRGKVKFASDPEADFYGACDIKLTDRVDLAPGFTLYDYPHAPTGYGYYRSTIEPNVALNYTAAGIRFTPKIYYDLVKRGPTWEIGADSALPLAAIGTELDFTGVIGTGDRRDAVNHANSLVKAHAAYWQAGVALPFQIIKGSKITLGWAYASAFDAYAKTGTLHKVPDSLAAGRGVLTITYTRRF